MACYKAQQLGLLTRKIKSFTRSIKVNKVNANHFMMEENKQVEMFMFVDFMVCKADINYDNFKSQ